MCVSIVVLAIVFIAVNAEHLRSPLTRKKDLASVCPQPDAIQTAAMCTISSSVSGLPASWGCTGGVPIVDICTGWAGVICGDNCDITYIGVVNQGVSGTIPSAIGSLTALGELHLYNNAFSGSIPSEIGLLTNLVVLELDNNQLTNSVPTTICNLNALARITLDFNALNCLPSCLLYAPFSTLGSLLSNNKYFDPLVSYTPCIPSTQAPSSRATSVPTGPKTKNPTSSPNPKPTTKPSTASPTYPVTLTPTFQATPPITHIINPGAGVADYAYQGGPLLINAVNIYHIYYGDWSGRYPNCDASAAAQFDYFATHIGSSAYLAVLSSYNGGAYSFNPDKVIFKGSVYYTPASDPSHDTSLGAQGAALSTIFATNLLTYDPLGLYMIIFDTNYDKCVAGTCAEHSTHYYNGYIAVPFASVYNLRNCAGPCLPLYPYYYTPSSCSPTGSLVIDAMISNYAHEFIEAITDPFGNGWIDPNSGAENEDICNSIFLPMSHSSPGWSYGSCNPDMSHPLSGNCNIVVGSRCYIVQAIWNAILQSCVHHW